VEVVSSQIFEKLKPVRARKHVHINGNYESTSGFLRVIKACKMLTIPVLIAGNVIDHEYYQRCFSEGGGAILRQRSTSERNDLYNLSKIYVCNQPILDLSMMEAMKCGCYILCSSLNPMSGEYKEDGFWVYEHHDQRDFEEKIMDAYYSEFSQQNTSWWAIDHEIKIYP
jgi:hypothetical protein|tara:strand:- start:21 stop:527 length:507 start_codon:yes stop_codon:yes gene_type:complete